MLVGPPWAQLRFRWVVNLFLATILLSGVQAVQDAQTCDSHCQEQQGLALQRVLQGLLGPGQTLDLFASPNFSAVLDYTARQGVVGFLNNTALAAAGYPKHCLLPGNAPACCCQHEVRHQ